eukprot:TRINITY_DN43047_c0_g1_i1.p1 TRINITY_DN43047_c0_g1~~TRINITY_DN43047_c0_g1_i1.p1  ORF type:complete len:904 (-),score=103.90 TRINITY_DN43047_c0_g1_i1:124-2835(-)
MAWGRHSMLANHPRVVAPAADAVILRYRHFGQPPDPASCAAASAAAPAAAPISRRRHGDLLRLVTIGIVDTFGKCSGEFGYSNVDAPRRVLTKPSKGVHNNGYDNAENDYICRVGDTIVNRDGNTYEILDFLGGGSFGQVVKCQIAGSPPIALKIIKNKPLYYNQALMEVRILQMLNKEFDPHDENGIIRMFDFFDYRKHLCIVFELLGVTLYDALKQDNFRGVSVALVQVLTEQLLKALRCLRDASIIHCDLKPENVLFTPSGTLKLIDFGAACVERQTLYPYIQSRFYRSPEVLVGLPYTGAIDMWSLGCISAELFLGLPIFPGHSEYDQVCRITEVLGMFPACMLIDGNKTRRYFRKHSDEDDSGEANSIGGEHASGEGSALEPSAAVPGGAQQDVGRDEALLNLVKHELDVVGINSGQPKRTAYKDGLPSSGQSTGSGQSTAAEIPETPARRRAWTGSSEAPCMQGTAPSVEASSDGWSAGDDVVSPEGSGLGQAAERPSRANKRVSRTVWRMKTREEYERDSRQKAPTSKKYFNFKSLEEMIELVPFKPNLSSQQESEERQRRLCLLQFLSGLLNLNPRVRWTPKQASQAPFILGTRYDASFQPAPEDCEPIRAPPLPPGFGAWSGGSSVSSNVSTPSVRDGASSASGGLGRSPQGYASVGGRAPTQGGCPPSSRTWSRGSSPWKLPSSMSEMSTASENTQHLSQPWNSDSAGEPASHGNLDESGLEDPSHSDTSGSQWQRSTQCSDSDSLTPQSGTKKNAQPVRGSQGGGGEPGSASKDSQASITRVDLSRVKLLGRVDTTLNSGVSARGNFREMIGMNESGPVNPLTGHGPRRDGISSMMRSHAPATGSGGCAGGDDGRAFNGTYEGGGRVASSSSRGSGRGGHSRRRGRRHSGMA